MSLEICIRFMKYDLLLLKTLTISEFVGIYNVASFILFAYLRIVYAVIEEDISAKLY